MTNNKLNDTNCKGCLLYNADCETKPIFNNEYCPCSICLVKMVCYKGCHELRLYRNKYEEIRWNIVKDVKVKITVKNI